MIPHQGLPDEACTVTVIPRRVWLAVILAFLLHGVFILAAQYRFSYDAYTHMLFADHYQQDWWSLWDPRWYAGFFVTSYPPLVHQLIGLLGKGLGVDTGYALVSWIVLAAYPLAVFAFSRVFVNQKPAEYAALGASILPSIYLTAYTFGQLPTLTGTLLALFCAAALAEYLKIGRGLSGALAVMLAATMMGAHHATLLFLPWLVLAVGLHLLLSRQIAWQKWLPRLAVFGILAILAGLLVIWPFWQWGQLETMQTSIDHPTRHNLLTDPAAAFFFFWSVYGPLVAIIPFALKKIAERSFFPLAFPFGFLLILGLGGTTPLPRWLFGSGWAWLTYDRFAFWATLLLLPFLGLFLTRLELSHRINRQQHRQNLTSGRLKNPSFARFWNRSPSLNRFVRSITNTVSCNRLLIASFASLAGISILVSLYPTLLPTQPKTIDMQPIVDYLVQGDHAHWRYLTFGFGDQFAYLNRLTSATTIDGSYHTARALPELRASGIGSIDSTYWLPNGLSALGPILTASGKYGVRWGFVNDRKYVPALLRNGWVERTTLSDGVQVWENPGAVLPKQPSPPAVDPLASFSWGTLPLLALALTGALAGLRFHPSQARQSLLALHTLAIGLLPIALGIGYFRQLTSIEYPRIYFTYDNAFFTLSDALAFTAVLAWLLVRGFLSNKSDQIRPKENFVSLRYWLSSITPWLLSFCLLASLSVLWSKDWRVSLYLSLHLWLGFALFVSLRDRPGVWKTAMIGFCALLGLQAIIGFFEFAIQSTGFLAPLKIVWPGVLDPNTPGASVVQLADGTRWLRAYGTMAHPNILGTFVVVLLAGPAMFFLFGRKPWVWAITLFSAGTALLFLSFSRGAWVGLLAGGLFFALRSRRVPGRRSLALGIAGLSGFIALAVPLRALIFTRLGGAASVPTEAFSIKGRAWLAEQAVAVIHQHPLFGIGIGSFVINLAQHAAVGYIIEPVHSLPLLVFSELGIGGVILLAGMVGIILKTSWNARNLSTILASAALIGLGATSLFDHSLWTLAPGRIFLAMVLGLWAGQVEHENH